MKGTKFAIVAVMIGLLGVTSYAQDSYPPKDQPIPPNDHPIQDKSTPKMADWGSAAFDRTVDGLKIQVWIMEENKTMGSAGTDHSMTNDAAAERTNVMAIHTHRIRVKVGEGTAEKATEPLKVEVATTTPAGTASNTALTKTADAHEGSLTLTDGAHKFKVVVTTADGKKHIAEFEYSVS